MKVEKKKTSINHYLSEKSVRSREKVLWPNVFQVPIEIIALESTAQRQARTDRLSISETICFCIIPVVVNETFIKTVTYWIQRTSYQDSFWRRILSTHPSRLMQLAQDLNKEFDLLLLERCKGSISEKRVQHDCTETFQPDHRTAKSEKQKRKT
jgi:hypothetical protein